MVSSRWNYVIFPLVVIIVWRVGIIVYNICIHPLRHFPGPFLHRASRLPWSIRHARGEQAFHTQRLHDQYGPVVRIGPNHLSFTNPQAWKDIYGNRAGGEMPKSKLFTRPVRGAPTSVLNADHDEHQQLRRALAFGFSDSSMRQQEAAITRYVSLLIDRLSQECDNGTKAMNMASWYNWTTFDLVSDLVFGESFYCLEKINYHPCMINSAPISFMSSSLRSCLGAGILTEFTLPNARMGFITTGSQWKVYTNLSPGVSYIFKAIRFHAIIIALTYSGLGELVQLIHKAGGFFALNNIKEYTNSMLRSRMSTGKGRNDLFEGLAKKQQEWNLPFEKLSANATILLLAGSETTATTLSGITYLLLTNPEALARLQQEVRSTFSSSEEITIASVGKLSYMLAALNETMRCYPPITAGMVRVVPRGGADIAGHFVSGGTLVEVQHWSASHSQDNFADPWLFRPERWLDTKVAGEKGDRLDAVQAFSFGPRNCIGRTLAYTEMRLVLAKIIFSFDLKLADGSENWIGRQKSFNVWDRIPLNAYLLPVEGLEAKSRVSDPAPE